jgi:voltage-gated potassium channel
VKVREKPSLEIVGTLVRSLVIVALLVVAYYQAPLDRPLNAMTAVLFGATLLVLGAMLMVEVRGIMRSARPRLRAFRALLVGVPAMLVVFAATYSVVDAGQEGAFSEPLSRTDGLYFTVTIFSTVGFGDITARSELARVLVTTQMVISLVTVGLVARLVVVAVHHAEARQAASGTGPADPTDRETTDAHK